MDNLVKILSDILFIEKNAQPPNMKLPKAENPVEKIENEVGDINSSDTPKGPEEPARINVPFMDSQRYGSRDIRMPVKQVDHSVSTTPEEVEAPYGSSSSTSSDEVPDDDEKQEDESEEAKAPYSSSFFPSSDEVPDDDEKQEDESEKAKSESKDLSEKAQNQTTEPDPAEKEHFIELAGREGTTAESLISAVKKDFGYDNEELAIKYIRDEILSGKRGKEIFRKELDKVWEPIEVEKPLDKFYYPEIFYNEVHNKEHNRIQRERRNRIKGTFFHKFQLNGIDIDNLIIVGNDKNQLLDIPAKYVLSTKKGLKVWASGKPFRRETVNVSDGLRNTMSAEENNNKVFLIQKQRNIEKENLEKEWHDIREKIIIDNIRGKADFFATKGMTTEEGNSDEKLTITDIERIYKLGTVEDQLEGMWFTSSSSRDKKEESLIKLRKNLLEKTNNVLNTETADEYGQKFFDTEIHGTSNKSTIRPEYLAPAESDITKGSNGEYIIKPPVFPAMQITDERRKSIIYANPKYSQGLDTSNEARDRDEHAPNFCGKRAYEMDRELGREIIDKELFADSEARFWKNLQYDFDEKDHDEFENDSEYYVFGSEFYTFNLKSDVKDKLKTIRRNPVLQDKYIVDIKESETSEDANVTIVKKSTYDSINYISTLNKKILSEDSDDKERASSVKNIISELASNGVNIEDFKDRFEDIEKMSYDQVEEFKKELNDLLIEDKGFNKLAKIARHLGGESKNKIFGDCKLSLDTDYVTTDGKKVSSPEAIQFFDIDKSSFIPENMGNKENKISAKPLIKTIMNMVSTDLNGYAYDENGDNVEFNDDDGITIKNNETGNTIVIYPPRMRNGKKTSGRIDTDNYISGVTIGELVKDEKFFVKSVKGDSGEKISLLDCISEINSLPETTPAPEKAKAPYSSSFYPSSDEVPDDLEQKKILIAEKFKEFVRTIQTQTIKIDDGDSDPKNYDSFEKLVGILNEELPNGYDGAVATKNFWGDDKENGRKRVYELVMDNEALAGYITLCGIDKSTKEGASLAKTRAKMRKDYMEENKVGFGTDENNNKILKYFFGSEFAKKIDDDILNEYGESLPPGLMGAGIRYLPGKELKDNIKKMNGHDVDSADRKKETQALEKGIEEVKYGFEGIGKDTVNKMTKVYNKMLTVIEESKEEFNKTLKTVNSLLEDHGPKVNAMLEDIERIMGEEEANKKRKSWETFKSTLDKLTKEMNEEKESRYQGQYEKLEDKYTKKIKTIKEKISNFEEEGLTVGDVTSSINDLVKEMNDDSRKITVRIQDDLGKMDTAITGVDEEVKNMSKSLKKQIKNVNVGKGIATAGPLILLAIMALLTMLSGITNRGGQQQVSQRMARPQPPQRYWEKF